jgi:hypothetical protein
VFDLSLLQEAEGHAAGRHTHCPRPPVRNLQAVVPMFLLSSPGAGGDAEPSAASLGADLGGLSGSYGTYLRGSRSSGRRAGRHARAAESAGPSAFPLSSGAAPSYGSAAGRTLSPGSVPATPLSPRSLLPPIAGLGGGGGAGGNLGGVGYLDLAPAAAFLQDFLLPMVRQCYDAIFHTEALLPAALSAPLRDQRRQRGAHSDRDLIDVGARIVGFRYTPSDADAVSAEEDVLRASLPEAFRADQAVAPAAGFATAEAAAAATAGGADQTASSGATTARSLKGALVLGSFAGSFHAPSALGSLSLSASATGMPDRAHPPALQTGASGRWAADGSGAGSFGASLGRASSLSVCTGIGRAPSFTVLGSSSSSSGVGASTAGGAAGDPELPDAAAEVRYPPPFDVRRAALRHAVRLARDAALGLRLVREADPRIDPGSAEAAGGAAERPSSRAEAKEGADGSSPPAATAAARAAPNAREGSAAVCALAETLQSIIAPVIDAYWARKAGAPAPVSGVPSAVHSHPVPGPAHAPASGAASMLGAQEEDPCSLDHAAAATASSAPAVTGAPPGLPSLSAAPSVEFTASFAERAWALVQGRQLREDLANMPVFDGVEGIVPTGMLPDACLFQTLMPEPIVHGVFPFARPLLFDLATATASTVFSSAQAQTPGSNRYAPINAAFAPPLNIVGGAGAGASARRRRANRRFWRSAAGQADSFWGCELAKIPAIPVEPEYVDNASGGSGNNTSQSRRNLSARNLGSTGSSRGLGAQSLRGGDMVYPPVTEVVLVPAPGMRASEYTVMCYDERGELVATAGMLDEGGHVLRIPIDSFGTGVACLKIYMKGLSLWNSIGRAGLPADQSPAEEGLSNGGRVRSHGLLSVTAIGASSATEWHQLQTLADFRSMFAGFWESSSALVDSTTELLQTLVVAAPSDMAYAQHARALLWYMLSLRLEMAAATGQQTYMVQALSPIFSQNAGTILFSPQPDSGISAEVREARLYLESSIAKFRDGISAFTAQYVGLRQLSSRLSIIQKLSLSSTTDARKETPRTSVAAPADPGLPSSGLKGIPVASPSADHRSLSQETVLPRSFVLAVLDQGLSTNVEISESGLSAMSTEKHAVAIVEMPMRIRTGTYIIAFRLLDDKRGQECCCFGAAFTPLQELQYDVSPCAYVLRSYNGKLYRRGNRIDVQKMGKVHPESFVEVIVDTECGLIGYRINGIWQGVAFSNIFENAPCAPNEDSPALYPAAFFYGSNRKIAVAGPVKVFHQSLLGHLATADRSMLLPSTSDSNSPSKSRRSTSPTRNSPPIVPKAGTMPPSPVQTPGKTSTMPKLASLDSEQSPFAIPANVIGPHLRLLSPLIYGECATAGLLGPERTLKDVFWSTNRTTAAADGTPMIDLGDALAAVVVSAPPGMSPPLCAPSPTAVSSGSPAGPPGINRAVSGLGVPAVGPAASSSHYLDALDTWACVTCTYNCEKTSSRCPMCQSPRPKAAKKPRFHAAPFACSVCTYENPGTSFLCEMCGNPRSATIPSQASTSQAAGPSESLTATTASHNMHPVLETPGGERSIAATSASVNPQTSSAMDLSPLLEFCLSPHSIAKSGRDTQQLERQAEAQPSESFFVGLAELFQCLCDASTAALSLYQQEMFLRALQAEQHRVAGPGTRCLQSNDSSRLADNRGWFTDTWAGPVISPFGFDCTGFATEQLAQLFLFRYHQGSPDDSFEDLAQLMAVTWQTRRLARHRIADLGYASDAVVGENTSAGAPLRPENDWMAFSKDFQLTPVEKALRRTAETINAWATPEGHSAIEATLRNVLLGECFRYMVGPLADGGDDPDAAEAASHASDLRFFLPPPQLSSETLLYLFEAGSCSLFMSDAIRCDAIIGLSETVQKLDWTSLDSCTNANEVVSRMLAALLDRMCVLPTAPESFEGEAIIGSAWRSTATAIRTLPALLDCAISLFRVLLHSGDSLPSGVLDTVRAVYRAISRSTEDILLQVSVSSRSDFLYACDAVMPHCETLLEIAASQPDPWRTRLALEESAICVGPPIIMGTLSSRFARDTVLRLQYMAPISSLYRAVSTLMRGLYPSLLAADRRESWTKFFGNRDSFSDEEFATWRMTMSLDGTAIIGGDRLFASDRLLILRKRLGAVDPKVHGDDLYSTLPGSNPSTGYSALSNNMFHSCLSMCDFLSMLSMSFLSSEVIPISKEEEQVTPWLDQTLLAAHPNMQDDLGGLGAIIDSIIVDAGFDAETRVFATKLSRSAESLRNKYWALLDSNVALCREQMEDEPLLLSSAPLPSSASDLSISSNESPKWTADKRDLFWSLFQKGSHAEDNTDSFGTNVVPSSLGIAVMAWLDEPTKGGSALNRRAKTASFPLQELACFCASLHHFGGWKEVERFSTARCTSESAASSLPVPSALKQLWQKVKALRTQLRKYKTEMDSGAFSYPGIPAYHQPARNAGTASTEEHDDANSKDQEAIAESSGSANGSSESSSAAGTEAPVSLRPTRIKADAPNDFAQYLRMVAGRAIYLLSLDPLEGLERLPSVQDVVRYSLEGGMLQPALHHSICRVRDLRTSFRSLAFMQLSLLLSAASTWEEKVTILAAPAAIPSHVSLATASNSLSNSPENSLGGSEATAGGDATNPEPILPGHEGVITALPREALAGANVSEDESVSSSGVGDPVVSSYGNTSGYRGPRSSVSAFLLGASLQTRDKLLESVCVFFTAAVGFVERDNSLAALFGLETFALELDPLGIFRKALSSSDAVDRLLGGFDFNVTSSSGSATPFGSVSLLRKGLFRRRFAQFLIASFILSKIKGETLVRRALRGVLLTVAVALATLEQVDAPAFEYRLAEETAFDWAVFLRQLRLSQDELTSGLEEGASIPGDQRTLGTSPSFLDFMVRSVLSGSPRIRLVAMESIVDAVRDKRLALEHVETALDIQQQIKARIMVPMGANGSQCFPTFSDVLVHIASYGVVENGIYQLVRLRCETAASSMPSWALQVLLCPPIIGNLSVDGDIGESAARSGVGEAIGNQAQAALDAVSVLCTSCGSTGRDQVRTALERATSAALNTLRLIRLPAATGVPWGTGSASSPAKPDRVSTPATSPGSGTSSVLPPISGGHSSTRMPVLPAIRAPLISARLSVGASGLNAVPLGDPGNGNGATSRTAYLLQLAKGLVLLQLIAHSSSRMRVSGRVALAETQESLVSSLLLLQSSTAASADARSPSKSLRSYGSSGDDALKGSTGDEDAQFQTVRHVILSTPPEATLLRLPSSGSDAVVVFDTDALSLSWKKNTPNTYVDGAGVEDADGTVPVVGSTWHFRDGRIRWPEVASVACSAQYVRTGLILPVRAAEISTYLIARSLWFPLVRPFLRPEEGVASLPGFELLARQYHRFACQAFLSASAGSPRMVQQLLLHEGLAGLLLQLATRSIDLQAFVTYPIVLRRCDDLRATVFDNCLGLSLPVEGVAIQDAETSDISGGSKIPAHIQARLDATARLSSLGFERSIAWKALELNGNDAERAAEWLLSGQADVFLRNGGSSQPDEGDGSQRWAHAKEISVISALPPKLCYLALESMNDDSNRALAWLLDHGSLYAASTLSSEGHASIPSTAAGDTAGRESDDAALDGVPVATSLSLDMDRAAAFGRQGAPNGRERSGGGSAGVGGGVAGSALVLSAETNEPQISLSRLLSPLQPNDWVFVSDDLGDTSLTIMDGLVYLGPADDKAAVEESLLVRFNPDSALSSLEQVSNTHLRRVMRVLGTSTERQGFSKVQQLFATHLEASGISACRRALLAALLCVDDRTLPELLSEMNGLVGVLSLLKSVLAPDGFGKGTSEGSTGDSDDAVSGGEGDGNQAANQRAGSTRSSPLLRIAHIVLDRLSKLRFPVAVPGMPPKFDGPQTQALTSFLARECAWHIHESTNPGDTREAREAESLHPHLSWCNYDGQVVLEGARALRIRFDPRCQLGPGCRLELSPKPDFGRVWTFSDMTEGSWKTISIHGDRIYYRFLCANSIPSSKRWGWKFSVSALSGLRWMNESERVAGPSLEFGCFLLEYLISRSLELSPGVAQTAQTDGSVEMPSAGSSMSVLGLSSQPSSPRSPRAPNLDEHPASHHGEQASPEPTSTGKSLRRGLLKRLSFSLRGGSSKSALIDSSQGGLSSEYGTPVLRSTSSNNDLALPGAKVFNGRHDNVLDASTSSLILTALVRFIRTPGVPFKDRIVTLLTKILHRLRETLGSAIDFAPFTAMEKAVLKRYNADANRGVVFLPIELQHLLEMCTVARALQRDLVSGKVTHRRFSTTTGLRKKQFLFFNRVRLRDPVKKEPPVSSEAMSVPNCLLDVIDILECLQTGARMPDHVLCAVSVTTFGKLDDKRIMDTLVALSEWEPAIDEQLLRWCSKIAAARNMPMIDINPTFLDTPACKPPRTSMAFPRLAPLSTVQVQCRFALLQLLNKRLARSIEAIDLTATSDPASLAFALRSLDFVVFPETKQKLVEHAIESTFVPGPETLACALDNALAFQSLDAGIVDPNLSNCIFMQAYRQIGQRSGVAFRCRLDDKARLIYVRFVGEEGLDYGGIGRDSVIRMVEDLFVGRLDLFVQCSNAKRGAATDRYVPNPKYSTGNTRAVGIYEFVGKLMGHSWRHKQYLGFLLPGLVWKLLAGNVVDLSDLLEIDDDTAQALLDLEEIAAGDKPLSTLATMAERTFTVPSAYDGQPVELVPGGASIRVDASNYKQFTQLAREFKLREFDRSIAALQRGLYSVIPERAVKLCSSEELETFVCGDPTIDVDVLRNHTFYVGYSRHDRVIRQFWNVMESLSNDERSRWVRFAWGRSRLPRGDNWDRRMKISRKTGASDQELPISHSCMFAVELPAYSSEEIMRQRILASIYYGLDGYLIL